MFKQFVQAITLALSVALCGILSSCCSSSCEAPAGNADAALANIMSRTSIRKYTDQKLDKAQIETLLRAGMAAPSAVNKQPWDFVVITNDALLDSLEAVVPTAPIRRGGCSTVLAVCGNMQKAMEGANQAYWIQDCSAATQNILLAANAMGLGAVWCGVTPRADRIEGVSRVLNLPSYIKPLCLICVGYPAENPAPKDKWNVENVHYDAQW